MNVDKNSLFYFDAEWVPITKDFIKLGVSFPALYTAWENKCKKWNKELEQKGVDIKDPSIWFNEKAHWYPEYIKMICISYGYFNDNKFILKSLYGNDEKDILTKAAHVFNKVQETGYILSGVAIKRFDMPFISKRMAINGVKPPSNLSVYGKKPWEVNVFDLPEVWGQGCNQETYTPFEWMCASLGIETSKGDIGGADVARVYYEEGADGLERIKTYCELDVKVSADLAEKLIELLP